MPEAKKKIKRRNIRLTAKFVRDVTKCGRYGDGRGGFGLSLFVTPRSSGGVSKIWTQRVRIDGRQTNVGLGSYPTVPLSMARKRAIRNAVLIERGESPIRREEPPITFRQAAEATIKLHEPQWKHAKTAKLWRSGFENHVHPHIGDRAVAHVTTPDLVAILAPLMKTKRSTAEILRRRIGLVMRWSIANNHRKDDPSGRVLTAVLPRNGNGNGNGVTHRKALPHARVGEALAKVRTARIWTGARLAVEFIALTACRSGEARGAEWSEIDFESATWTIPAERMKMGREHRVPLSVAAVEILIAAKTLADGSGLVFPSSKGGMMTDNTLSKLFRDLEIDGTIHGLRSSFRDWAAEVADAPNELAEFALGHVVGSAAVRAYLRTDLFEKRRTLMQAWADYVMRENGGGGK